MSVSTGLLNGDNDFGYKSLCLYTTSFIIVSINGENNTDPPGIG